MRVGEKDLRHEVANGGANGLRACGLWAWGRIGIVCLLPALAAACTNMDVAGIQAAAGSAPAAAPRTTGGTPATTERKRLVDLFGGEYSAPATERYLNDILVRL